jgi:2,4-dienoyl-CoA reductase-like NADH-dependent reductase (Old Yellow Enzyme family)
MRKLFPPLASFRAPQQLRDYLDQLGIDLPFDDDPETGPHSFFAEPYYLPDGATIGNRICAQPMEGWDATPDGRPSDLTRRRWLRMAQSGAKLIWGCEAVAVCPDGRSGPHQLMINRNTLPDLAALRAEMVTAHAASFEQRHLPGGANGLLIGLQLTHSGRYSCPEQWNRRQPVLLYHHPYLDAKMGLPPNYPLLSDARIEELIDQFIDAAVLAAEAGFDFVDIKHCHGYLGQDFLTAYTRPGPYGGSFMNRTRFTRRVLLGIRQKAPRLRIGVRLSAFDLLAYEPDPETGIGRPVDAQDYPTPFGADPADPLQIKLDEPARLLELLRELGVTLVNLTAGCSFYNTHIMRPARYPAVGTGSYQPPEDPLAGVARQIAAVAELKKRLPELCLVGSAYSYLQEWLPNVAAHNLRSNRVDFIGLGRALLANPDYPADLLAGQTPDRKHLCRSFSDCISAPRSGLVSGCYPFDSFYHDHPAAAELKGIKAARSSLPG